jgi:hypothetical protein
MLPFDLFWKRVVVRGINNPIVQTMFQYIKPELREMYENSTSYRTFYVGLHPHGRFTLYLERKEGPKKKRSWSSCSVFTEINRNTRVFFKIPDMKQLDWECRFSDVYKSDYQTECTQDENGSLNETLRMRSIFPIKRR